MLYSDSEYFKSQSIDRQMQGRKNDALLAVAVFKADDDLVILTALASAICSWRLCPQMRIPAVRFDLTLLFEQEARFKLRFSPVEVRQLVVGFRIPDVLITPQGIHTSGTEDVCLMMRRLLFPSRLKDSTMKFGRHWTVLGSLFNMTLAILYDRFKDKIEFDAIAVHCYATEREGARNMEYDAMFGFLHWVCGRHHACNLPFWRAPPRTMGTIAFTQSSLKASQWQTD